MVLLWNLVLCERIFAILNKSEERGDCRTHISIRDLESHWGSKAYNISKGFRVYRRSGHVISRELWITAVRVGIKRCCCDTYWWKWWKISYRKDGKLFFCREWLRALWKLTAEPAHTCLAYIMLIMHISKWRFLSVSCGDKSRHLVYRGGIRTGADFSHFWLMLLN